MMQQRARIQIRDEQWVELVRSWARNGTLPVGRVKTARLCIEAGLQLLALKEVAPQEAFLSLVNQLGFRVSVARRYMVVARRFHGASDAFCLAVGSPSKLVELLPLDDAGTLAKGEEVHGLTLDRVALMTVQELRAAVIAVVAKEREAHSVLNAATGNAAMRKLIATRVVPATPSPKRPDRGVRLNAEEERMLRRYRKCNAEGRAALLQVAGLLEHKPAP